MIPNTLRELRVNYRNTNVPMKRPRIKHPSDAVVLLQAMLAEESQEVFGALLLDTTHQILCWAELGRGTLDSVYITPAVLFQRALLANAAAVIVAHNHPSGDPTPSPADVEVTIRLAKAGLLLGIPILDHVVIGEGGSFVSFYENGIELAVLDIERTIKDLIEAQIDKPRSKKS